MSENPQKLWNLTQRQKHWWRSVRESIVQHAPMVVIASAIASLGWYWMLEKVSQTALAEIATTSWLRHIMSMSGYECFAIALFFSMILAVPIIFASVGHYPRQKDVENDQALRRLMGMPDEVSTETDI